MRVELAAKVTVGAGVNGAAVPLPQPPKAKRAAKQIITIEIERKRAALIGAILQADWRQSAQSELPKIELRREKAQAPGDRGLCPDWFGGYSPYGLILAGAYVPDAR
jgi:hypothetical protein